MLETIWGLFELSLHIASWLFKRGFLNDFDLVLLNLDEAADILFENFLVHLEQNFFSDVEVRCALYVIEVF